MNLATLRAHVSKLEASDPAAQLARMSDAELRELCAQEFTEVCERLHLRSIESVGDLPAELASDPTVLEFFTLYFDTRN